MPIGDPMQGFGLIIDTTNDFSKVQRAVSSWSMGKKIGGHTESKNYKGKSVCYLSYENRKPILQDVNAGKCEYFRVKSGESVDITSGINGIILQGYNPNIDFGLLQIDQPLCKSVGKLNDFRPKKNADGTCFKYIVKSGDTCSSIANKYYPLTVSDIDDINQKTKTFFWKGCNKILKDQIICLSDGIRHKPKPNPLTECGPYAPGNWNVDNPPECRNNACCSKWGFCGYTQEFCETCYSNCGYGTLPTVKATSFDNVIYWIDADNEMYYNPQNIDSKYNIVHYAFANITDNFDISVGRGFDDFLQINATKKIAIGGWEFSTNPSSYHLFREAVQDANRPTFVRNILKFVNKYNLDGVDFDWEYPEAPDIPGIPAGDKEEGKLYNQLFKDLKAKQKINLSVAIPASPWYLKGFPLADIDKNIDYFVLMNYDYAGQWDYGKNEGIQCHVDFRNTKITVKMMVKSGINTRKLYGGVANYTRTYKLADTNCITYGCSFTGPESGAEPGPLSNSPGVMTERELLKISNNSKTNIDSWCEISTYNTDNWASWMKATRRSKLVDWYKYIGLGGSALWAANYENIELNSQACSLDFDANKKLILKCLNDSGLGYVVNMQLKDVFDIISSNDKSELAKYFNNTLYTYLTMLIKLQRTRSFFEVIERTQSKYQSLFVNTIDIYTNLLKYYVLNNNDQNNDYMKIMLLLIPNASIIFTEDYININEDLIKNNKNNWSELNDDNKEYIKNIIKNSQSQFNNIILINNLMAVTKTHMDLESNILKQKDYPKAKLIKPEEIASKVIKLQDSMVTEADLTHKIVYYSTTIPERDLRDLPRINYNENSDDDDSSDIINDSLADKKDPTYIAPKENENENRRPEEECTNRYKYFESLDHFVEGDQNLKRFLERHVIIRNIHEYNGRMLETCGNTPIYIINSTGESPSTGYNFLLYIKQRFYENKYHERNRYLRFRKHHSSNLDQRGYYQNHKQCDCLEHEIEEFPYNSMMENDRNLKNVNLLCIPHSENSREGAYTGHFYSARGQFRHFFPEIEEYVITDEDFGVMIVDDFFGVIEQCFPKERGEIASDEEFGVFVRMENITGNMRSYSVSPKVKRLSL
ncbi:hypothetical protein JA1_005126 [Spathaspora sp. JA1]|nr:hypothetical protein JA1_005126 [Spathaspora sp. JA1]